MANPSNVLIHLAPKFYRFCSSPLMAKICTKKQLTLLKKKHCTSPLSVEAFRLSFSVVVVVVVAAAFCIDCWNVDNWKVLSFVNLEHPFPRVWAVTKVNSNFLRWYRKFAITVTGVVFRPESESCRYGFTSQFLWGGSWRNHYLHLDSSGDGVESWEKARGNVYGSVLMKFSILQLCSAHS